jgi:hypothetical protein
MQEQLIGAWDLTAAIAIDSVGDTFYPMGRGVEGRIVYSQDGYVAVNLMEGGRKQPDVNTRWARLKDPAAASLARTYMAYSGRFAVDEERSIVHHHLDMCLDPNLVGTDQVRQVEFTPGGELKLSVPLDDLDGQPIKSTYLTWRRADA